MGVISPYNHHDFGPTLQEIQQHQIHTACTNSAQVPTRGTMNFRVVLKPFWVGLEANNTPPLSQGNTNTYTSYRIIVGRGYKLPIAKILCYLSNFFDQYIHKNPIVKCGSGQHLEGLPVKSRENRADKRGPLVVSFLAAASTTWFTSGC